MKRLWGLGLTLALATWSLVPSSASASLPAGNVSRAGATSVEPVGETERVPGEVVVRYAAGTDAADRAELRSEVEADSVEEIALARTEVIEVPNGTVDEAIATLEQSPGVAFAEPNFVYRAAAMPNDPRFQSNWGLHNTGQSIAGAPGISDADIDAPEAWEATKGSRSIVVAVIDSGVAYGHPDLAPNIWRNPGEPAGKESNGADDDDNGFVDDWRGWDFVDDDNTPRDFIGHGTHVAGTIGASGNDGYGTVGVNWQVSLMPLRVLGNDGSGTTADVADAITYAAAHGADVVNLSLSGPDPSLAVGAAINGAPQVLVAAAAGNEATNNDVTPSYPCNYSSVNLVCVAATDNNDDLAGYSNYGAVSVDLAAPGSRVLSSLPAFNRAVQETFESDISGTWVPGGTGTQWSRGLDQRGSFAADSVDGKYLPSTDSWLRMKDPVDLTGVENCQLTYVFQLDTESAVDVFTIEGSSDGTTWGQLGGWTGSTGQDWLNATHDLVTKSGVDLEGDEVYLRLRLTSNLVVERDGVSVDDLSVRCLGMNYTGDEFGFFSGTSMATPHVAGAAALVLSLAPQATVAELRSALLGGADSLSALAGKVGTGGRLNVFKSLGILVPSSIVEPLPTATPTATPTPTPTPSASLTPSPTPTPSPSSSDIDQTPVEEYERQVSLRLRGHLKAIGRISVPQGLTTCLANVVVKIKRNGVSIRSVTTDATGTFITRLRDRSGRYVAKVPGSEIEGGRCLSAASSRVGHIHG